MALLSGYVIRLLFSRTKFVLNNWTMFLFIFITLFPALTSLPLFECATPGFELQQSYATLGKVSKSKGCTCRPLMHTEHPGGSLNHASRGAHHRFQQVQSMDNEEKICQLSTFLWSTENRQFTTWVRGKFFAIDAQRWSFSIVFVPDW